MLSLILVLRKRLQFTVQLFRIVGKIIGRIPFLLFQPFWTFLILVVFWVFWVAVLLSLGTAGKYVLSMILDECSFLIYFLNLGPPGVSARNESWHCYTALLLFFFCLFCSVMETELCFCCVV